MLQLNGILKSDEIKEFTKKDGSIVKKRIVYVEPKDSIFPLKVSIDDLNLKLGKCGEQVSLSINVYPFYFEDGKMKRALINYYVTKK